MKKLLLILFASIAISSAHAVAWPDANGPVQRVENASSAPSVSGGVGHITFSAGSADAVFSIYSITGQLLKTVRVGADGHVTMEIPKGFYVVRCGSQWSRKVVVK